MAFDLVEQLNTLATCSEDLMDTCEDAKAYLSETTMLESLQDHSGMEELIDRFSETGAEMVKALATFPLVDTRKLITALSSLDDELHEDARNDEQPARRRRAGRHHEN